MVGMRSIRKKKMTSIGSFDGVTFVNDIGNPYLHKRQDVHIRNVDNSKVGRAIVFDQHIIDKLYTREKLDEKQHNVCDKYLSVIARSGAFAKAPSSMEKIFDQSQVSGDGSRACILSQVHRIIIRECGRDSEKVFWKVMTVNPKQIDQPQLDSVVACANALLQYWYVSQQSPISLFQKAFVTHSQ